MLKRKVMLILTAFVFAPWSWAADESNKLHLLTENYPPYNMASNNKNFAREENIEGIATDIVREVFKRAGVDYSMTLRFPWSKIYKQVLEKPGYGAFIMSRSAEREALFKWVGPIGPDDWVFLARNDSPIVLQTLEDALKYRVGSYKDDVITEYLEKNSFTPTSALRDQENAFKLVRGDIDLWATGEPAGRYLAAREGIRDLKIVLSFNHDQLYLGLNKETDDDIVARLQSTLDEMRKNNELDQYFNKYL